ncbi:MAG: DUF3341 domain-containing protein [Planctomycetota bacterium]|jgi:hypothetical protein
MLIGFFGSEEGLVGAVRAARARGFRVVDAFTPYPVEGLGEALGAGRSRLPFVCLLFGAVGAALALGFQLWVSAIDWPLNIGGKSFTALPALVPITFEIAVFFAAVGTALVFLRRARLWPGRKPRPEVAECTDDRFAVAVEGDEGAVRAFFEEQRAVEVRPGS